MSDTEKAAPRPWRVKHPYENHIGAHTIHAAPDHNGFEGYITSTWGGPNEANAALIVRAVNRDHLFDELVETLDAVARAYLRALNAIGINEDQYIRAVRTVLARVDAAEDDES